MWAVVLLPRWLGTSDRYRDARTTQRFRRSLRSVSTHRSHDVAAMPGARAGRVDTAPADSAIDQHLDLGIDPFVGSPEDGHRRRARRHESRRHARAAAAARRKRILIGLGSVTGLSLAGVLAGAVPVMFGILSTVALGAYVYLLVAQAKARARVLESRRRDSQQRQATEEQPQRQTWEPVQAPVPSYMRAPRATAVPREIDSELNGPWTAERMLEQAAALRASDDIDAELGLDEYAYPQDYQPLRAVNE
jgi:hypothetical protein